MEKKRFKFTIEFDMEDSHETSGFVEDVIEDIKSGEFAQSLEEDGFTNVICEIVEL